MFTSRSCRGPAPSPPKAAEPTPAEDKNAATTNGNDEDEEESEDEESDEDELAALDESNIITTGRRTRGGPKPDYVGQCALVNQKHIGIWN